MKIAKIKFEPNKDLKPYVEGNYEFNISKDMFYSVELLEPVKKISFYWSVEQSQDIAALQKDNELFEMLADQLKQDFLQFLINKSK